MLMQYLLWVLFLGLSVIGTFATGTRASGSPALQTVFQEHFLIGGAFNRDVVTGNDPNAAAIAIRHFNTATPENDMKWSRIHPRPDQYNWEPADRFVAFAEENHMVPIGHCLVWHNQVPRWTFRDDSGEKLSREALLARMKDHIMAVVGRYKGRVKGWDVVNEALDEDGQLRNSRWRRIIGDDYIAKAFEYAHEADPEAELYYNDYSLASRKDKADGAVRIVKDLQSRGLRIDGVGIQLHGNFNSPSPESLSHAIEAFAACGVKVMITELDIRTRSRRYRGADVSRVNRQNTSDAEADTEATQQRLAQKYAELFSVFLQHKDDISRVTFWGVYDATSWIGGSPLLFDRNYQPKLAFDAVIQTVQSND